MGPDEGRVRHLRHARGRSGARRALPGQCETRRPQDHDRTTVNVSPAAAGWLLPSAFTGGSMKKPPSSRQESVKGQRPDSVRTVNRLELVATSAPVSVVASPSKAYDAESASAAPLPNEYAPAARSVT